MKLQLPQNSENQHDKLVDALDSMYYEAEIRRRSDKYQWKRAAEVLKLSQKPVFLNNENSSQSQSYKLEGLPVYFNDKKHVYGFCLSVALDTFSTRTIERFLRDANDLPAYRDGTYALFAALYSNFVKLPTWWTQAEIESMARPFSNPCVVADSANRSLGIWRFMKELTANQYVIVDLQSTPHTFSLSQTGLDRCVKIFENKYHPRFGPFEEVSPSFNSSQLTNSAVVTNSISSYDEVCDLSVDIDAIVSAILSNTNMSRQQMLNALEQEAGLSLERAFELTSCDSNIIIDKSFSSSTSTTARKVEMMLVNDDDVSCQAGAKRSRHSSSSSSSVVQIELDSQGDIVQDYSSYNSSSSSSSCSWRPVTEPRVLDLVCLTSVSVSSASSGVRDHSGSKTSATSVSHQLQSQFPAIDFSITFPVWPRTENIFQRTSVPTSNKMMLLVDNRERTSNAFYLEMFNKITLTMGRYVPACHVSQAAIKLGDFNVIYTNPLTSSYSQSTATDGQSLIGDLIVERKALNDIVGRSAGESRVKCGTAPHYSQERRLRYCGMKNVFMMIEAANGQVDAAGGPLRHNHNDRNSPDLVETSQQLIDYYAGALARNFSEYRVRVIRTTNIAQSCVMLSAMNAVCWYDMTRGRAMCAGHKDFDVHCNKQGNVSTGREKAIRDDLQGIAVSEEMTERVVRRFGDWLGLCAAYMTCLHHCALAGICNIHVVQQHCLRLLSDLTVGGSNQDRDQLTKAGISAAQLELESTKIWNLALTNSPELQLRLDDFSNPRTRACASHLTVFHDILRGHVTSRRGRCTVVSMSSAMSELLSNLSSLINPSIVGSCSLIQSNQSFVWGGITTASLTISQQNHQQQQDLLRIAETIFVAVVPGCSAVQALVQAVTLHGAARLSGLISDNSGDKVRVMCEVAESAWNILLATLPEPLQQLSSCSSSSSAFSSLSSSSAGGNGHEYLSTILSTSSSSSHLPGRQRAGGCQVVLFLEALLLSGGGGTGGALGKLGKALQQKPAHILPTPVKNKRSKSGGDANDELSEDLIRWENCVLSKDAALIVDSQGQWLVFLLVAVAQLHDGWQCLLTAKKEDTKDFIYALINESHRQSLMF